MLLKIGHASYGECGKMLSGTILNVDYSKDVN